MEKKIIREKILDMRRSLTSKYIEDASSAIFDKLTESEKIKNAKNVLIYSDFDNEVKTAKLTGWLLFNNKDVYLPVVHNNTMYAMSIKSSILELSRFGVAQPKWDKEKLIAPDVIDLIITPGVAFDNKKNRLGFGFGYYDKFFKQAKSAYRIGLAYDFQIVEDLPTDSHDVSMDIIITQEVNII